MSTVLDASIPTNLSPLGTGTNLTPTFTWADQGNASSYVYHFWLFDTNWNVIWAIPSNNSSSNGFSSSITSLVWGIDPTDSSNTPSVSSLTSGAQYYWAIQAYDSNGNSAGMGVGYIP